MYFTIYYDILQDSILITPPMKATTETPLAADSQGFERLLSCSWPIISNVSKIVKQRNPTKIRSGPEEVDIRDKGQDE
jgi:hypothetical protein